MQDSVSPKRYVYLLASVSTFSNVPSLASSEYFVEKVKYFDFEWHSYDKVLDFVHPSKISKYNASRNGRLFCQKFVQEHITHISF